MKEKKGKGRERESGEKTKTPQKKLDDGLKTEGGNKKKKKTIRRIGENKAKSERYYTPGKGIIQHKHHHLCTILGKIWGRIGTTDKRVLPISRP